VTSDDDDDDADNNNNIINNMLHNWRRVKSQSANGVRPYQITANALTIRLALFPVKCPRPDIRHHSRRSH